MNKVSVIIAAVLLITICTTACKKPGTQPTLINFTIKGRLLKDCSGAPASHEALGIMEADYEVLNAGPRVVGADTTDSAGYFSVKCTSYGGANTYYLKQDWANKRVGGVDIDVRKDTVIDIGTLFDSYTAGALLQFRFAQPHSDTLFVASWDGRDTFFVYPAADTQYAALSRSLVGRPFLYFSGYYGFGRAGLVRPSQGIGGANITADHAYKLCGSGDTTAIDIP